MRADGKKKKILGVKKSGKWATRRSGKIKSDGEATSRNFLVGEKRGRIK